jgi:hypothetical protein
MFQWEHTCLFENSAVPICYFTPKSDNCIAFSAAFARLYTKLSDQQALRYVTLLWEPTVCIHISLVFESMISPFSLFLPQQRTEWSPKCLNNHRQRASTEPLTAPLGPSRYVRDFMHHLYINCFIELELRIPPRIPSTPLHPAPLKTLPLTQSSVASSLYQNHASNLPLT